MSIIPFDLPVAILLLDQMIRVNAFGRQSDVIAMHTKIAVVLVQCFQVGHIRCVLNDLVDPFDTPHHFVALLFVEHGRALVLRDLFVRVNTNDKIVP